MTVIAYDATRISLFHPGQATDFFQRGNWQAPMSLCAEMSRLAYVKNESRLTDFLKEAKYEKIQALGYGSNGTQAFIASKQDANLTVVAFRGTEPEDPSDLFADARFSLVDWADAAGNPMGQVHDGFAALSQDHGVLRAVKAHIDTLPTSQQVLFTGHSLGAALATLMASWVQSAQLYTFGSPRVGNAAFAQAMQPVDAKRVVNCCDLATRVPPEPVFGYVHVGKQIYIDRDGRVSTPTPNKDHIDDDRRQAAAHYLTQHAFQRGTVFSRDLADHAPINYVSGIMGIRA